MRENFKLKKIELWFPSEGNWGKTLNPHKKYSMPIPVGCCLFIRFNTFAVKCHSIMWNWLLGLPERIRYEQKHAVDLALHVSHLVQSRWLWTFSLGGLLLCLMVIPVNPAVINDNPGQEGPSFTQNLMHPRCSLNDDTNPHVIKNHSFLV